MLVRAVRWTRGYQSSSLFVTLVADSSMVSGSSDID